MQHNSGIGGVIGKTTQYHFRHTKANHEVSVREDQSCTHPGAFIHSALSL